MQSTALSPWQRTRFHVPWDWTDVLLCLVLTVLGMFTVAVVITQDWVRRAAAALTGTLSAQTQNALAALVEQALLYAVAIAVVLWIVMRRRRARLVDLGWRGIRLWWIPVTALVGVGVYFAVVVVGDWFATLFPEPTNPQVAQTQSDFGHIYALAILSDAVIAPLAEETFFRGFIYGALRRYVPVAPAALVAGAFFAILHPFILFAPILVLGIVLALVYEYSGSLIPGALIHAGFNLYNLLGILGG